MLLYFSPFFSVAVLWLCIAVIWRDHYLEGIVSLRWATAGEIVGWGGQRIREGFGFSFGTADLLFSEGLHVLLTMAVVSALVWWYFDQLQFGKILRLFIGFAVIRFVLAVAMM